MLHVGFANIKNIPHYIQGNTKYSTEHTLSLQILTWGCRNFWHIDTLPSISVDEHGKPFFGGHPDKHFNVSHSHGYVVVAFSDHPVGIDIEQHGKTRMQIAERFFHPLEVEMLKSTKDTQKTFFDLWAAKECYMKYLGCGLSGGLNSFWVNLATLAISDANQRKACLQKLGIEENFSAFVCSLVDETAIVHDVSAELA